MSILSSFKKVLYGAFKTLNPSRSRFDRGGLIIQCERYHYLLYNKILYNKILYNKNII